MVSTTFHRNPRLEGDRDGDAEVLHSSSSLHVLSGLGEKFDLFDSTEEVLRFRHTMLEEFRSLCRVIRRIVRRIFMMAYRRYHDRWPKDRMGRWRIRHDLATFWQEQELPHYVLRSYETLVIPATPPLQMAS